MSEVFILIAYEPVVVRVWAGHSFECPAHTRVSVLCFSLFVIQELGQ